MTGLEASTEHERGEAASWWGASLVTGRDQPAVGVYEQAVGLGLARNAAFFWLLFAISWVVRLGMDAPWRFEISAETLANPFLYIDLLNNLILVYVLWAGAVARRGAIADLHELRPVLVVGDDEFERWEETLARPDRRIVWGGGALFALLLAANPVFDQEFWAVAEPVPIFSVVMFFFAVRLAATGWFAGQSLVWEFLATRTFGAIGHGQLAVDSLDLRPLRPFARKGLRSSALWLVASSLVSLYWLGPATMAVNTPIVLAVLALALFVFLWPAFAVHGAIREAKERELDRLRERIRAEERKLDDPAPQDARLANLVAYYGLVSDAREWPIEAPVVLRFVLFAVIGLGSWLGAALVERWLELWVG